MTPGDWFLAAMSLGYLGASAAYAYTGNYGYAVALFAYENNWQWPDPAWPLMPKGPLDWYRLVSDVPESKLTPRPAANEYAQPIQEPSLFAQ